MPEVQIEPVWYVSVTQYLRSCTAGLPAAEQSCTESSSCHQTDLSLAEAAEAR